MTDQQTTGDYGDRPEVETSDTEVVHGADGPPADEPGDQSDMVHNPQEQAKAKAALAELESWRTVPQSERNKVVATMGELGLDPADLEEARAAGEILRAGDFFRIEPGVQYEFTARPVVERVTMGSPSEAEDQADAYAEDPSAFLRSRARMIAATDQRPAELADDSGVEVESSGEFSGFTEGFVAGRTAAQTPPEPEDYVSFDLYRSDGSRLSITRAWPAGADGVSSDTPEVIAEIRRVALLMEEAVEGGA